MKNDKGYCLSCKFFRLDTPESGVCRVVKDIAPNYPSKGINDACQQWQDSGQQYFIRIGWIKAKKAET